MSPLLVLVSVTVVLAVPRLVGREPRLTTAAILRGGLAAMFVVTGASHFVGMRDDMIAMVPPALPAPELLVTLTGLLELAGAAGLLLPRVWPWAAAGLTGLLLAMFPANVYAATAGLTIGGAPAMELLPRTLLQLAYLAATTSVVVLAMRRRGQAVTARQARSLQAVRR